jgi:response regulator of citrate/malate metabolism
VPFSFLKRYKLSIKPAAHVYTSPYNFCKNLKPSCVSSIADARKAIAIINPLLLFLDNRLPDGFGIDYIPEIKQEHPHTKIVMITAHNSMQEIQTAFNNGADYFISKPFNAEIIKNTIDLIIRKTFVNP